MKKHAKIKFLHKRKVIILSLIGTVFITSGALAYSLTTNTQQTKPMAIVQVQTTTPTPSTTPIAPPTSTPTPTVTSTTQPIETSESPSPSPALAPGVDINKIPYYTDTNPYSSGSVMGYIFDNRKSTGKPIGAWGNISYSSWRLYGVQSGYIVDSMPEVGAIALSMINLWFDIVTEVANDGKSFTMTTVYDGKKLTHTENVANNGKFGFAFIH